MAKVIKGITIEIGGNASPLNKALNDVNKTSKSLQSELRTIDKLLKLDPSNTELLTQKQDVLSESIETTEEKLRRLKSAEEKVAQAFEDGKVDAEQYRAFQRNIVTTEQKLNDLKSELNKTSTAITNLGTDAQKSEKKLDDYKKEVDDVKSAVSDLKDKAKDTVLELGAGATAVGGAASAAIMSFDSVEGALNHLQAQTGISNTEMDKFKTVLETVYNNNFGEDMQDIANVMASVAQHTGETDPNKIKEITENVFALNDAFEYDSAESLRAMNMLMDQFGLSAEEAFNLIVQGTQKGLNKNGDLLDSVNEYAVHYKQLGYTAEEFFNSLENGTNAGTFSVDKLGDAVKEFGIRTKDTASTTVEAFTLLGYSASASSEDIEKAKDEVDKLEKNLYYAKEEQKNFNESTSELTKQKNADKIAEYSEQLETAKNNLAELTDSTDGSKKSMEDLQAKFAAGGDSAKEATKEVLEQLFELDDQVLQNQIGVDLFGTMWEDLGIDGVKALMDVTGEADKATDSMEKIKDIEYDDLGNRLEGIGRKVQTEIINPAVEDFYPEAEGFIDWISDNLDTLIPILEGVARQLGIIWTTKKVNEFRKSITNVISTYKTLKAATEGATTAQKALNVAQNSNAIGLVISLVGTLVNVFMTLNDTLDNDAKKTSLLTEEQEKLYESIDKNKQSWDELTQARSESSADITTEYGYYESLLDELEQITDKNGKIKSGYEDRADTIINTLSGALDIEIEKNGNVITNYQDICKEIQKTIDLERARSQQQVYADSYEEAIKNQTQAWNDLKDAQENEVSIADKIAEVQAELDENTKEYNKTVQTSTGLQRVHTSQYDPVVQKQQQLQASLNSLKTEQTRANQKTKDAQDVYLGYVNTIKNYEGVTSAIAEGDTKKINDALNRMVNNFITAENGTKESLEQQVADMKDNYNSLKTAVDEGAPGVTQSMVDNAKSMVDTAVSELDKFKNQTPQPAKDGVDAFTNELTSDETNGKLRGAGQNLRDRTNEGIDGEDGAYQIGFGKGKDYGNGFCGGIADSFFPAYQAGDSLAAFAMKGTQDKQKSNSPSKEARKLGNDNGDGYVLGVIDKKDDASEAGEALAENALSAMRARQKIINSFSQTNNNQNNMILPSVSAQIRAQTAAKSNNAPEVKQINLGGLTLKIEHFENRSAADVNKVTDQFMHAVENYVNRREAFK